MKAFVVLLVLLAAGKVGYREYLYRSSTNEVIAAAYRERAVQACQLEPRNAALGIKPAVWSSASTERLAIGKPGLGIYLWQIDNALWNARYRNPYLFLKSQQRSGNAVCEYDIVNGAATISRL